MYEHILNVNYDEWKINMKAWHQIETIKKKIDWYNRQRT